ncbi:MAG: cytochrome b [Methyloligellaceae bacterium]
MAHESTYKPGSGIEKWLDERLPILRFMQDSFGTFPTPRNLNYLWTFGAILTFCLVIQIVTGLVLAMHYTPHVDFAFESIQACKRDVNFCWLLQPLHAVGASMFFIAVYIHIFRGMYYGSYKAPREILWMLGVVILLLMMAIAFMGYVLPWGQMSFWGATVITKLFSAIPWVGDSIVTFLLGGFSVDNPTLNRFFVLHFVLPFVLFGVVLLHIWALHVPGSNNPTGVEIKDPKKDALPFHPYYSVKDLFGVVVFCIMFAWFVFFVPDYLGHADNYIPANPGVTPPHIVPEWYFLPFYAILRSIDHKLLGVIAMASSILILLALPWLDTSKVKSARYRPTYRFFFWLLVVSCLALGYLGAKPPEGYYKFFSQIFTAYYFIHFLIILPLLGLMETPEKTPNSINESIFGDDNGGGAQPNAAAAAAPEKR